jgi:hypothetical protein
MSTETIVKSGSLRKLDVPQFLSLVEKGANKVGFKTIRGDGKAAPVMRADHPLLSIYLPEDRTESEALELMDVFGLGADYEVMKRTDSDGYMFHRKNAKADVDTTTFDLGDGMVADVASSTLAARADSKVNGVVVTSIEFENEHFDVAGVDVWLRGNEVNFKEGGVEVVDGGFIVTRHDVPEGEALKKVAIQDGVTAVIAQAERADIPVGMLSPVSEYAYGSYGWGQLDFAAAIADPIFTSASWNALSTLGIVLEDIIFYSSMSIDERRVLISRALGQFGDFMNGLLDALPQEVLIQIRSDKTRKEFAMISVDDSKSGMPAKKKDAVTEDAAREDDKSTEKVTDTATEETAREDGAGSEDKATDKKVDKEGKTSEDAARDDGESGDGGSEGSAADDAKVTSEFVTRSELEDAVTGAVDKALASREDSTATALGGLQDTMSKLVDSIGEVKRSNEESNTALSDKLAAMESETVVRSDDDDHEGDEGEKSVFKGAIFGSR